MLGMILAGGGGTRLWPYSRSMSPKQFLNLGYTKESLLQETYQRLMELVSHPDIYVVGSHQHEFELVRQIEQIVPHFPRENLLFEPQGRNTAPAILWPVFCLPAEKLDEPIIILPADHLIPNTQQFIQYLQQGAFLASENKIVTFGIKPEHPETGYGYIKSGNPLSVGYEVETFVEKPDRKTAEQYLKLGQYTWNSGIFISTPKVLMEEYQAQAPEMFALFDRFKKTHADLRKPEVIEKIYQQLHSDSFDYAILEKSQRVAVLPVDLSWSDLGSWESIYQVSRKDEKSNVIRGNVILQDTHHCLIFSTKKLVTSIGVENLIIVETDDALLVCDLSRSQDVKQLVETLKEEDRHEYKFHTTQLKSWGSASLLHETATCKIKMLEILPGKAFFSQKQPGQSQHWIVIQGVAEIFQENESFRLLANESTYVPQSVNYHIKNIHNEILQFIVIQQEYQKEES